MLQEGAAFPSSYSLSDSKIEESKSKRDEDMVKKLTFLLMNPLKTLGISRGWSFIRKSVFAGLGNL